MNKQQQQHQQQQHPKRRGDRVPWLLAQSTSRNERIGSLLSALLLRQPLPSTTPFRMENRLPYQILMNDEPSSPSPSSLGRRRRRMTILLLVLDHDDENSILNEDFSAAIKAYTEQSSTWFVVDLKRRSLDDNESSQLQKQQQFKQRWSNLHSLWNKENTDVFILVDSQAGLRDVSQQLLLDAKQPNNIRGILSFWTAAPQDDDKPASLPYISSEYYHLIVTQQQQQQQRTDATSASDNNRLGAVSQAGARVVNESGTTICLCLDDRTWPPPTAWLVKAAIWFASAVQSTSNTCTGTAAKFHGFERQAATTAATVLQARL